MPSKVYDVTEVRTIREMMSNSATLYADKTAFLFKNKEKAVCSKTYAQAYEEMIAFATYLLSKGYENKKIAVMGSNCYEWALTYLAVTCGCGIIVPIDKELKAPDVENILKVSETSLIIHTPDVSETINSIDGIDFERICTDNLPDLIDLGRALIEKGDTSYQSHQIDPYALGILLFTSGTTGMAKGVMLSHYNICSNIVAVRKGVFVSPDDRTLSVLPLHHTYECTAGFLTVLYSGASIAYAENLRRIPADLQLFSPTILVAVPLLLENIHANIKKKLSAAKGGKLKFAIGKGIATTAGKRNNNVKKRVFKQIHNVFGGKLEKIICGAAALSPEIAADFDAFGLPVYNGYGLTETSPVCIMHNDWTRDFDSIGKPMSGVFAKLDSVNEEGVGEIVVKGPNVMLGYYKNPEETARVIRDGWFYTGDLGTIDKNGNYRIVGRIKNMIVTKNGKKIFPEEMEYHLSKSPFIKESMVYGEETDSDVIVTAVIYPDFEAVDATLAETGIAPGTERYNVEIKKILSTAVKEANTKVPAYKLIRRFLIRYTEFDKTTTKKIRRTSPENLKGEV